MKHHVLAIILTLALPLTAAAQTAVDCEALINTEAETSAAVDAVALGESTRRALAVRSELLRPGAQIRLFPNTTGIAEREFNLHKLDDAFAAWKLAVDAQFTQELAAEAAYEAAVPSWVKATIKLEDAITDGHCKR